MSYSAPATGLRSNESAIQRLRCRRIFQSGPYTAARRARQLSLFPKAKKNLAQRERSAKWSHRMYGTATSRSRRPIRNLIDQGEPS